MTIPLPFLDASLESRGRVFAGKKTLTGFKNEHATQLLELLFQFFLFFQYSLQVKNVHTSQTLVVYPTPPTIEWPPPPQPPPLLSPTPTPTIPIPHPSGPSTRGVRRSSLPSGVSSAQALCVWDPSRFISLHARLAPFTRQNPTH
jgi:hypothetical protein